MTHSRPYTRTEIDKLGNAVVFLAERIKPLSKTKLLKLIYLIEEYSVRNYGLPFFNIDFTLWKLGPVARDIYVDLSSDEPTLLNDFIKRTIQPEGIYITPAVAFSDDEFSDNEIELLSHIVATFKNYTATELIDLTHRKHSLWYTTAKENNVLEYLESGLMPTTDIEIDFSKLLEESPLKKAIFNDQKEYLKTSQSLKI